MPKWKPKTYNPLTGAGLQRPQLVTLEPRRSTRVWIVWQIGNRLPRSYHVNEDDARHTLHDKAQPGIELCLLRAEIVATARAALVVDVATPTESTPHA